MAPPAYVRTVDLFSTASHLAFRSSMSSSPVAAEDEVSSDDALARSRDSLGASWRRRGEGKLRWGRRRTEGGGKAAPTAGRRAPPRRGAVEHAVAAMSVVDPLRLYLALPWPLLSLRFSAGHLDRRPLFPFPSRQPPIGSRRRRPPPLLQCASSYYSVVEPSSTTLFSIKPL